MDPFEGERPVAIITDDARRALVHLDKEIESYRGASQRGKFKTGQEFLIVTNERGIMGALIGGVRVVGQPDHRLVAMAEQRLVGYRPKK